MLFLIFCFFILVKFPFPLGHLLQSDTPKAWYGLIPIRIGIVGSNRYGLNNFIRNETNWHVIRNENMDMPICSESITGRCIQKLKKIFMSQHKCSIGLVLASLTGGTSVTFQHLLISSPVLKAMQNLRNIILRDDLTLHSNLDLRTINERQVGLSREKKEKKKNCVDTETTPYIN